jgi:hypothetical protein
MKCDMLTILICGSFMTLLIADINAPHQNMQCVTLIALLCYIRCAATSQSKLSTYYSWQRI